MEDLQHNSYMKTFTLITGSSSGIGQNIAIKLSSYKNIILHGRDRSKLEKVKMMCSNDNEILIWENDLKKIEEIENSLSNFIRDNNILINTFIHSAGYMKMLPFKMSSFSLIQETLNVNLISAMLISKIITNKKINNLDLSCIIFISSNISNFGAKALSIYGASKSALDGFMRGLAIELSSRKIRVNSILPGGIKTPMTENIYNDSELISRIELQYPLGLGESNDISNLVEFLISDNSRWITGQQFVIDGGRTINISG